MVDLAELQRWLSNLFRIGIISSIEGKRARVKFDDNETDLLPWLTSFAGPTQNWGAPQVGEQVMIGSLSGQPEQGIILGKLHQDRFGPAPSDQDPDLIWLRTADGSEFCYDKLSQHLKAKLAGSGTADISAPGGLTFRGDATFLDNVRVKKDIKAEGDITDFHASMADARKASDTREYAAFNSPPKPPAEGGHSA